MAYRKILETASNHLASLTGKTMPVLEISKPQDLDYAQHLAKVISKLSVQAPQMGARQISL